MLLQQLTLQNLLSFGSTPCVVPLRPLNVLIGPNGSGKSNFIEAISLLRAAPNEITAPIRDGGGILEWIWKGLPDGIARIESQTSPFLYRGVKRHRLDFVADTDALRLVSEEIDVTLQDDSVENIFGFNQSERTDPILYEGGAEKEFSRWDYDYDSSILAKRKDPDQYPEITSLGKNYNAIQFFREWTFGRYTAPRLPQKTTQRNDRLSEDFSNLGMMLNRIRRESKSKQRLLELLNQLYTGIDDFDVIVEGGTVQVFFQEGNFTIPATRLSDGTLRYLCLLVILLQPSPPPLVCIEEPELGLHPDVLPGLADLMREASQRMQLVVTTHSDILVDALSDTPEDIVICEKHDGATTMRRLESDKLKVWLDKYTLGELWRSGELGGNRW